jgi:hypothetical protein
MRILGLATVAFLFILIAPSSTAEELFNTAFLDQVFVEPQPILEPNIPLVPAATQTIGSTVVTLTTTPERLPPSEGTLIITLQENNLPVAGEQFTLRLEGRKRILVETTVVTDENGQVRLATYFASPGNYELIITTINGQAVFPLVVRGTQLLVIGLLVASGVLFALLFEKRLL